MTSTTMPLGPAADDAAPAGCHTAPPPAARFNGRRRRVVVAATALLLLPAVRGGLAAPSQDGDDQSLLADDDYKAGREALRAGNATAALPRLQSALRRFPDAADLHNELGFAHRKLRQLPKAFEHYKRALALNPSHRSAHEYIGEAYLMADDLPNAEKHLAALRLICLLPCEEMQDLAAAIEAHRTGRAAQAASAPGR